VARRERLALGVLVAVLLAAVLAGGADAARKSGGTKGPQAPKSDQHPAAEPEPPAQLRGPSRVSGSTLAKELGSSGQVDPVAGLGIRNPVCDRVEQIRERSTRLACEASGSPEADYPSSNYGFDVFIETGITHPVGSFTAAFVTILNGIWLGMIFVLKLVLALLGVAFGLNPFAKGGAMGELTASIARVYNQITDPWLPALIVCGGIWFAYRGLIRRDVAAGVGGTLAAIAMLIVGLWVVHQPRASVGRLADLSNQVALQTISAPHSGSLRRPVGSYAEAMSGTWTRLVEVPFAGLNFSDVGWALSPPPPEAVERADAYFCDDIGALTLIALESHLGSTQAQEECRAFARKRYGRPKRVIDLYLRSSPGSAAREALWDYFDKDEDERYKAKVAAQGGDGALTRLSMLALFVLGLLGAILLLAWLAIRLFTQAAIAFVLLLAAPFALFLPLLGDAGRRAFRTWGLTLVGAVLAKVIYAAFLSIVLLGISVLGRAGGEGGSATGFLLSSAFAWSVFLKRSDLVGWLQIGEIDRGAGRGLGAAGLLAVRGARGATRSATDSVRGFALRGAGRARERRALGAEATRRSAANSLQGSARALAEHRLGEARHAIARYEASAASDAPDGKSPGPSREMAARTDSSRPRATPDAAPRGSPDTRPAAPSRERYEAARQLVARAERNQARGGARFTDSELRRYGAEDRELLERSRDPADHAHRVGLERSRFEELRGPERERVEVEIERARKRDLGRLGAVESPGRALARPRLAAERLRQGVEGGATERRSQLAKLRRERRATERLAPRRNLSRGS
jgi:hypothetical protein